MSNALYSTYKEGLLGKIFDMDTDVIKASLIDGADYTFNGSRAPSRIATWTNDASDEDSDADEDHADPHPADDLPQTQHNVWDYIADRPVFIVGREMNWFEVESGHKAVASLSEEHARAVSDWLTEYLGKEERE